VIALLQNETRGRRSGTARGTRSGVLPQGELRFDGTRPPLRVVATTLEDAAAAVPLRVLRVADLCPGRVRPALISPVGPLRDDAFQVVLTGHAEQIDAAAADRVHAAHAPVRVRQETHQPRFPTPQRLVAQIAAVDPQHVKGHEERRGTPEHQVVELAASIRGEAADLTVQHRGATGQRADQFGRERRPGREHVRAAGHESATPVLEVRERPEAILFRLKHPGGIIEGLAHDGERHGWDQGKHDGLSVLRETLAMRLPAQDWLIRPRAVPPRSALPLMTGVCGCVRKPAVPTGWTVEDDHPCVLALDRGGNASTRRTRKSTGLWPVTVWCGTTPAACRAPVVPWRVLSVRHAHAPFVTTRTASGDVPTHDGNSSSQVIEPSVLSYGASMTRAGRHRVSPTRKTETRRPMLITRSSGNTFTYSIRGTPTKCTG
jgi:hypothetical protein